MNTQKMESLTGTVITYRSPGLMLVSSASIEKGKVIRFSKSGRNVLVEDTNIQPGESKIYQHWISKEQIIS